MKPIVKFDTAGVAIATHPVSIIKLEAKIKSTGAASVFIQVYDLRAAPGVGDVPVKVWETSGASSEYKEFKQGELSLVNGLYVCVSTTEASYANTDTTNNRFDSVQVELFHLDERASVSTVGDLTTGIHSQTVWSSGQHRLQRVVVTDIGNFSQDRYLLALTSGGPLCSWKVPKTTGLTLDFGLDGVSFLNGTGLTLKISSTPGAFAPTDTAAIYSEYL